jgi:hypothetical protein
LGRVAIGEQTQMAAIAPEGRTVGDILFLVGGTEIHFEKRCQILGTYYAPQALIDLGEATYLLGALYGQHIEIRNYAQLHSAPARQLLRQILGQ